MTHVDPTSLACSYASFTTGLGLPFEKVFGPLAGSVACFVRASDACFAELAPLVTRVQAFALTFLAGSAFHLCKIKMFGAIGEEPDHSSLVVY